MNIHDDLPEDHDRHREALLITDPGASNPSGVVGPSSARIGGQNRIPVLGPAVHAVIVVFVDASVRRRLCGRDVFHGAFVRPAIARNAAFLVTVIVVEAAVVVGLEPGHDPEPRRLARFRRDSGCRGILAGEGFLPGAAAQK